MKFIVVIGTNGLYTYESNGQVFKEQNIEGSAEFPVESSNVAEGVASYLNALANEKNLDTKAKLEFDLVEGVDKFRNASIGNALQEYVKQTYPLEEALRSACQKLKRDKELHIDKFGINYEGYSYKMDGELLVQGEFDLLAYTIHSKDVVEMMNF